MLLCVFLLITETANTFQCRAVDRLSILVNENESKFNGDRWAWTVENGIEFTLKLRAFNCSCCKRESIRIRTGFLIFFLFFFGRDSGENPEGPALTQLAMGKTVCVWKRARASRRSPSIRFRRRCRHRRARRPMKLAKNNCSNRSSNSRGERNEKPRSKSVRQRQDNGSSCGGQ